MDEFFSSKSSDNYQKIFPPKVFLRFHGGGHFLMNRRRRSIAPELQGRRHGPSFIPRVINEGFDHANEIGISEMHIK